MIMNGCIGTFVKVYTLLVIMCLALISASIFLGIRIGVEKISKNIPEDYSLNKIGLWGIMPIFCAACIVTGTSICIGGILISNKECM